MKRKGRDTQEPLQVIESGEKLYHLFVTGDFTNDIINSQFLRPAQGLGTVTVANRIASLSITSTMFDFAVLRHIKLIKSRSMRLRFLAKFANPLPYMQQAIGVGNNGNAFYFATNAAGQFVCKHQTGGISPQRKLTITVAATGAENASLTLNDILYTVPLTNAGGSLAFTAYQIAAYITSLGLSFPGTPITTFSYEQYVIFNYGFPSVVTGVHSFTSATAAGTLSTLQLGSNTTDYDYPISTFDPTKWNAYEITHDSSLQYANLSILNPSTARYDLVRRIVSPLPLLQDSDSFFQASILSYGSTTASTLELAKFEISVIPTGVRLEPAYTVNSVKTIVAATDTPCVTLKNNLEVNGNNNYTEMRIRNVTVTTDGTKSVLFKIIRNAVLSPTPSTSNFPNWTRVSPNQSIALTTSVPTTYSDGTLVAAFTLAKNESQIIDLLNIVDTTIYTLDTLTVTAISTAGSDVTVSIIWTENQ